MPCTELSRAAAAEVNSLTSAETELPFDYYSLPFCPPTEGPRKSLNTINPGTILMGSRILNSPYNFTMLVCLVAFSSTVHDMVPVSERSFTGGRKGQTGLPAGWLLSQLDIKRCLGNAARNE